MNGLNSPTDSAERAGQSGSGDQMMKYLRANERKFECQSKGAIELGELESRQGRNKVSQFSLEHQSKKIQADGASARQTIFWSQYHFGGVSPSIAP